MANKFISFKKIMLTGGQTIQDWLASYYYPNIGSWPAYTRFTFYNEATGEIVGEYINDKRVTTGINESELLAKEDKVNKVTTISSTPTDINYPSEKAVKTALDNLLTTVNTSLDNKVNKNASITGGTFTKITFDSKGLVTGGANLTKADIPNIDATQVIQDATHRFVTDTEKSTWNNKVDKVAGKGLSTNDLTNTLKSNYDTAYGWGNHASVGYITSNGISGMTSGQVAIAGSGSTITGSRAIDATIGGTSGSTNLITSGAVFSGLATNYPEIIDLTGGS